MQQREVTFQGADLSPANLLAVIQSTVRYLEFCSILQLDINDRFDLRAENLARNVPSGNGSNRLHGQTLPPTLPRLMSGPSSTTNVQQNERARLPMPAHGAGYEVWDLGGGTSIHVPVYTRPTHRVDRIRDSRAVMASSHSRSKRVIPTSHSHTPATDAVSALASEIRALQLKLGVYQQRRAAERAATRVGVDSGDGLQQDPDCPICFDTLTKPSSVITACGHMFHDECIMKAIKDKSRPACPLCRSSMHPAELRRVMNGIPENTQGRKTDPEVVEIDPVAAEEEIIDLTGDVGGGAESTTKQGKCACGGNGSAVDTDITMALSEMRKLLNGTEAVKDLKNKLLDAMEENKQKFEQVEKELREQHDRVLAKIDSDRIDVKRKRIDAEKIREELKEEMNEQKRQAANINEVRAKLDFERKNIESKNLELQRRQDALEAEREALALKSKKMDDLIEQKAEKRANKKVFDKYKEIASLKHRLKEMESKKPQNCGDDTGNSDSDLTPSKNSDDEDDDVDVVAAAEQEYERQASCKKRGRAKTAPKDRIEALGSKDNGTEISLISTFNPDPLRTPRRVELACTPEGDTKLTTP